MITYTDGDGHGDENLDGDMDSGGGGVVTSLKILVSCVEIVEIKFDICRINILIVCILSHTKKNHF